MNSVLSAHINEMGLRIKTHQAIFSQYTLGNKIKELCNSRLWCILYFILKLFIVIRP